jgi:hypothetical protein
VNAYVCIRSTLRLSDIPPDTRDVPCFRLARVQERK